MKDINTQIKNAMLSKETVLLNELRQLKTAFSSAVNAKGHKSDILTDEEAYAVIRKQISMREDAIRMYKKSNRPLLVEQETAEMNLLQGFLPAEISDEDLEFIVKECIIAVHAKTKKDMSKTIVLVKSEVNGGASPKRISSMIMKKLK